MSPTLRSYRRFTMLTRLQEVITFRDTRPRFSRMVNYVSSSIDATPVQAPLHQQFESRPLDPPNAAFLQGIRVRSLLLPDNLNAQIVAELSIVDSYEYRQDTSATFLKHPQMTPFWCGYMNFPCENHLQWVSLKLSSRYKNIRTFVHHSSDMCLPKAKVLGQHTRLAVYTRPTSDHFDKVGVSQGRSFTTQIAFVPTTSKHI
eukprot:Gb_29843 [translate_table: standard]